MSLFDYAQKIVSDKLERKKPMLSVSMGSMPMPDKMQTYMNRPVLPNTPAGKMDGSPFMEAAEKRGIPTTNKNMNMMVDLVNRGVPLQEAANLTEQKLMPMAQGGGLSTVQNSLNINGQPHRLAYINPSEKNLLQQLGGSGRKIDGIPAYDDSVDGGSDQGAPDDGIDDSVDGGSNQSAPDGGFGNMGLGGYSEAQSVATTQGLDAAMAEADAEAAAKGEAEAYSSPQNQAVAPDLGFYGPYSVPEQTFMDRSEFSKSKGLSLDFGLFSTLGSLALGPLGAALGKGLDAALDTNVDVNTGIGAQSMGYGDTGTGTQGGSGQDDDDGTDAGGDDIIIREKIATVKKVPVEEVTVEEVERAKKLTAAQRVAGTRLEDILDNIYGSGQGSDLLSLAQSGGGIASLQKNINIDGQPHQLSYINPSEENLLRQIGGSGEKINGIPAYMMGGADGDHGYGDAPGDNDSSSTDDAAAGASASGGGDQAGGDDAPPEPEPVVAPKEPEVIIPKVEEPEPPKQPRTVNTNLADILQATYPNLSKSAIASMLGGLAAKEEKDSEEDFETDEEIINLLKKEGNPFPTPEDIQKYKSELNMKSILTQVYGNSNLLNNTGIA